MPPKIEILDCVCKGSIRIYVHHLNFQYNNFLCLFFGQKMAFVCEFQHTPLRKMIFF
jgi:hypothetical protein